jgi:hypothetical protein
MPVSSNIIKLNKQQKFKANKGHCAWIIWGKDFICSRGLHFSRSCHQTLRRNFSPFRKSVILFQEANSCLVSQIGSAGWTSLCFDIPSHYKISVICAKSAIIKTWGTKRMEVNVTEDLEYCKRSFNARSYICNSFSESWPYGHIWRVTSKLQILDVITSSLRIIGSSCILICSWWRMMFWH